MSDTNIFGRLISGGMVEKAVVATLDLWMDTYLFEAERLSGYQPGEIERPLGIIPRSEFQKWPEEQMPFIVVVSHGLAGKPERHKDGHQHAEFVIACSAIVGAADPDGFGQDAVRDLMHTYALAMRAAIGQHKMLQSADWPDGLANGTTWQDESYDDLPSQAERAIGAARVVFNVGVDGVMTEYAGPRTPLVDPSEDPGNWPEMADGYPQATVENIGIEESVTA